jgi:4'-phosphopantetheinyl transferase EntD
MSPAAVTRGLGGTGKEEGRQVADTDRLEEAIRWPARFDRWRREAALALGCAQSDEIEPNSGSHRTSPRDRDLRLGDLAARRALVAFGTPAGPIRRTDFGIELSNDLVGSLSHSGGRAVAAVGDGRSVLAVGIDLESGEIPLAALHLVATDAEDDWVHRAPTAEDSVLRLRTLFSLKESVYKAWSSLHHARPPGMRWISLEPDRDRVLSPAATGEWLTVAVVLDDRSTVLTGAALLPR